MTRKRKGITALLIGKDIAEERRRYRRMITQRTTRELQQEQTRYMRVIANRSRVIANHPPNRYYPQTFYLYRVRAIRNEIKLRHPLKRGTRLQLIDRLMHS